MRSERWIALGVGALLGCGSADAPHTREAAPGTAAGTAVSKTGDAAPGTPAPGDSPMTDRIRGLTPFRGAAPCVLAGDRVLWWDGGAVMSRPLAGGAASALTTSTAPTRVLGAGAGGPVAVTHDRTANLATLVRLAGAKPVELAAEYASTFADAAFAYAPSADRVLIASRGALQWFKVAAKVEVAGRVEWKADQLATVTGLADGVVYGEGGGIVRVGPGDQRAAFTSPIGSPVHLAAGADRDHVWASSADAVALLALAGTDGTLVHKLELPGVYHLAAVDGDAAVLTVTMKAGAWDGLALTVIGRDGKVRWSKPLAVPKRQDASVVGGGGHVAVLLDGVPHVFQATDGAAVGP